MWANLKDIMIGKISCYGITGESFGTRYFNYTFDKGNKLLPCQILKLKNVHEGDEIAWNVFYDQRTDTMYAVSRIINISMNIRGKMDYMNAITSLREFAKDCYSSLGLLTICKVLDENLFDAMPKSLQSIEGAYLLDSKMEGTEIPYVFSGKKRSFELEGILEKAYTFNWGIRLAAKLNPETNVLSDIEAFDGSSVARALKIMLFLS